MLYEVITHGVVNRYTITQRAFRFVVSDLPARLWSGFGPHDDSVQTTVFRVGFYGLQVHASHRSTGTNSERDQAVGVVDVSRGLFAVARSDRLN